MKTTKNIIKRFKKQAGDGQDTDYRLKAKTFLPPKFIYVASVLDPSDSTYEKINKIICSFVNTGSTLTRGKRNWINQEILYGL